MLRNSDWGVAREEYLWRLYSKLCTRVATKRLTDGVGDERLILESLYRIFADCRKCLSRCVDDREPCMAIMTYLEEHLRPFLAKWFTLQKADCWQDSNRIKKFRQEWGTIYTASVDFAYTLRKIGGFSVDLLGERDG